MNRDIVEGNWKQFKGKVHELWGMLIGDHLDVVSGRRSQLAGEQQRAYGAIRSKTLRGAMRARHAAGSKLSNCASVGDLSTVSPVMGIHPHENH